MLSVVGTWSEHPDTIMTNFDHRIEHEVAKEIKGKELYAQYAGWDFCGYVYWDKEKEEWVCEVWCYHNHVDTKRAKTLEEIMAQVCAGYGDA